jgi:hypothetical protein
MGIVLIEPDGVAKAAGKEGVFRLRATLANEKRPL